MIQQLPQESVLLFSGSRLLIISRGKSWCAAARLAGEE